MKKNIIATLLLCACFLAPVCVRQGSAFADQQITWKEMRNNIDSWITGPVSLILTSNEKEVWSKLKTPEEKMQFIKIFWARRDPILRTRENEFKEEFYKRVDYANGNFAERETPGWKTARGQVYIMFGPPSRIDHQTIRDSSRPALLWVYDNLSSKRIPANEAMMFVWHDFKYVLEPPNPDPGDVIAEQQKAIDTNFRYQSIPSLVQQAFADVSRANVIDESKNYDPLIYSVRSTEKFGIASINFDIQLLQTQPPQVKVTIPAATAPVYDSGNQVFAEFYFTQELKQGDQLVTKDEHSESYTWTSDQFGNMKEITAKLPALKAPPGQYMLYVTVEDRISNVSETKKIAVNF
jgi:GWxTD domain-containing protein